MQLKGGFYEHQRYIMTFQWPDFVPLTKVEGSILTSQAMVRDMWVRDLEVIQCCCGIKIQEHVVSGRTFLQTRAIKRWISQELWQKRDESAS